MTHRESRGTPMRTAPRLSLVPPGAAGAGRRKARGTSVRPPDCRVPADRPRGLDCNRPAVLATLMNILEGIFQSRVRHRVSPTPYIMGRGIPRAPVQWTPPPLTPPSSLGVPQLP